MKKFVCVIMIFCLLPIVCLSEDFSSLSYGELLVLHRKLTYEIMNRPEWKKVTVPGGIWTIGEDIPAGSYSITCADEYGASFKAYPDSNMDDYDFVVISGDTPYGKYTFTEGMVIALNREVIFAPPIILGF